MVQFRTRLLTCLSLNCKQSTVDQQFWLRKEEAAQRGGNGLRQHHFTATGRKNTRITPLTFYVCGCSGGKCLQLPLEANLVAAAREKHDHETRLSCHLLPAFPEKGQEHQGAQMIHRWFCPGWVLKHLLWPEGRCWGDSLRLWLPELVSDIWCIPHC